MKLIDEGHWVAGNYYECYSLGDAELRERLGLPDDAVIMSIRPEVNSAESTVIVIRTREKN